MKKILFASTALVATASVAAAEVSFGGYGRFGLQYQENRGAAATATTHAVSDTAIVSRFRLNIDGSATTDGGTEFSARVRLQADDTRANGEAGAATLNGARFSVEHGGLRVDVGNAAGAIDNLPNYYGHEPGLTNFGGQYSGVNYGFLGYSSKGTGSNAVYARYAFGDFAVAASFDSAPGGSAIASNSDRWDISAAYTFGNITAAIAHGETDNATNDSITVLTIGGDFGPVNATLMIGDEDVGGSTATVSDTFYGLSASYDVSAATAITFAYGDGSGNGDTQNVGLGVIHDLGGGVSLRGGIGRSKAGSAAAQNVADFGAQFSF